MERKQAMTQQLDDEYTAIHMGERLRKNPLANLGHSLTDKIGSQSSGLHLLRNLFGAGGMYHPLSKSINIDPKYVGTESYDDIMMHEWMHPALIEQKGLIPDILTDSNHDIINYIMLNDPDVSDGMYYGAREHFPERVSQEYADQLKSEVKSAQQGALQKLQR